MGRYIYPRIPFFTNDVSALFCLDEGGFGGNDWPDDNNLHR